MNADHPGRRHVDRAALLLDLDRPVQAIEAAQAALRDDPTDATAHVLHAESLCAARRGEAAIKAARNGLRVAPNDARLHRVLAHAHLETEIDAETARAALNAAKRAAKLAPADANIVYTLARTAYVAKHGPILRQAHDTLERLAPASVLAPLAGVLLALHRAGKNGGGSWSVVSLAVLTLITSGSVLLIIGLYKLYRGARALVFLPSAHRQLRRALAIDPDEPAVHRMRALVDGQTGRLVRAVRHEVIAAKINAADADPDALVATVTRRERVGLGLLFVAWLITAVLGAASADWPWAVTAVPMLVAIGGATAWVTVSLRVRAHLPDRLRATVALSPWPVLIALLLLLLALMWSVVPPTGETARAGRLPVIARVSLLPFSALVLVIGAAWTRAAWRRLQRRSF